MMDRLFSAGNTHGTIERKWRWIELRMPVSKEKDAASTALYIH